MKIKANDEIWEDSRNEGLSFETDIFNIYNPKYSSDSIVSSYHSELWSQISIDLVDKANAKRDPLFDAHSIEEIKIYSDYSNHHEPVFDDNKMFTNSPVNAIPPVIICDSPKIHDDSKFRKNEEGISMDNTNAMSSTMPSFSFKSKNIIQSNQSLLHNSKRLEQNSKDINRYENTFDTQTSQVWIPEESDKFQVAPNNLTQSRNFSIFDPKKSTGTYSKYLDMKHPFVTNPKFASKADSISEYR